jgi:hypothetical protein
LKQGRKGARQADANSFVGPLVGFSLFLPCRPYLLLLPAASVVGGGGQLGG